MNALTLEHELLRRHQTEWCPHTPTAKQAEFMDCNELEALYGGAAGGGKTGSLLMDPLRDVDTPGFSAIIFRRTFQDLALPDSIMDRAHQWLDGKDAHWDGTRYRFTFPSGATLQFGYLDGPRDHMRYKSAAFQSMGFDELTTIEEYKYVFLLSRLRRLSDSKVKLRVRAASNPGDIGHEWVKARFIDGDKPFFPALMDDNPHLDVTSYREALSRLDSVTRAQMERGIWDQDAAGLLYQVPSTVRISDIPDGDWRYIRALDFGIVDRNAITVLGWRKHDQATYILSSRYFKGGPAALADELAKDERPFVRTIGDLGGMGKAFQEDIQIRKKIPIERADKAAKMGAIRLINDDFQRGLLKIYAPACGDLLKEYGSLLRKQDGTEHAGQDNHCADATLYGWRACPSYLEREKVETPIVGTQAWQDAEALKMEREIRNEERRERRGRRSYLRGVT